MLKYLKIKGYQPYKKEAVLELSEFVNSITGETDAGKSSVVRAIRAVCKNDKSTLKFRNKKIKKGQPFEITLANDNGIVKRARSERENYYEINENGEKLQAGSGVPEYVAKILNIQDINLKLQFKDNFLIADSPPEVARYFNKLVKLDIIDTIFSNSHRDKLRNNQKKAGLEVSLKENNKKLERFKRLDELEESFKKAYYDHKELESKEKDLDNIERILEGLEKISSQLSSIPNLEEIRDQLDVVSERLIKADKVGRRLEKITSLISNAKEIMAQSNRLPSADNINKAIETLPKIKKDIEALFGNEKELKSLEASIMHLISIKSKLDAMPCIKGLDRRVFKLKTEIDSYTDSEVKAKRLIQLTAEAKDILAKEADVDSRLKDLKSELDKLPRCETCGQVLFNNKG